MSTTVIDPETRFEFGENWRRFLADLTPSRIEQAERSLVHMLGPDALRDRSFLDVGSGSGLFSLAAHRLGARVTSFDFDGGAVACTAELRERFGDGSTSWRVQRGSILDREFLDGLGQFDVVYSWGVLHHTGAMDVALQHVAALVRPGGLLYIALYNDQGRLSDAWRVVKRSYVNGSRPLRAAALAASGALLWMPALLRGLRRGRPLEEWRTYESLRGMSKRHDLVDWVGGYPFEVISPGEVFELFRGRGFELERLVTTRGLGCNEFVFRRPAEGSRP